MLNTTLNRRRLVPVVVAAAALASFGAPTAQARTQHHYTAQGWSLLMSSGGGYPSPGGTAVLVASWSIVLTGCGALIDHDIITGHPSPTTFKLRGSEVAYAPHGTIKDVF